MRCLGALIAVIIFLVFHTVPVIAQYSMVEQARRHFDRGMAAVEMARTPADYEKAIQEFERAAQFAPQWPDVYYNLGLVQEQAERYGDAVTSLKQYLDLAPNASDAQEVKSLINKLEYRKEQLAEDAAILSSLVGTWFGGPGRTSGDMYIITECVNGNETRLGEIYCSRLLLSGGASTCRVAGNAEAVKTKPCGCAPWRAVLTASSIPA